MIVVGLPLIARDLAVDRAASAWLVTSYLIAMASLQPIAGRVGDRFGRKRVMLVALAYFTVASIGAALAGSLPWLIAFRLQQAVAAAAIVPNGLGLLRGEAAAGRAGTYFGISGATTGIGAAAGPLLGGLLSAIDWRLIFAVNVPIALLALVLGWRALPDREPRPEARADVVGAVALGLILSLAAWTLTGAGAADPRLTAALVAIVVVAGVLFVRYEAGQPDAALPPRFFTIPAFTAANLTIALSNVALYGTLLLVPVALEGSSVRSGLALSALSVALIVLSPVSGGLVDRVGARWPTAVGGLCIAVGLAAPELLGRATDYPTLLIALPIAGAGVALTFPATRLAALDAVPAHYAALASGVTSSSRYFGGMVGALIAALALAPGAAGPLFLVFAAAGLAAAAVGASLPARIAPAPVLDEAAG